MHFKRLLRFCTFNLECLLWLCRLLRYLGRLDNDFKSTFIWNHNQYFFLGAKSQPILHFLFWPRTSPLNRWRHRGHFWNTIAHKPFVSFLGKKWQGFIHKTSSNIPCRKGDQSHTFNVIVVVGVYGLFQLVKSLLLWSNLMNSSLPTAIFIARNWRALTHLLKY